MGVLGSIGIFLGFLAWLLVWCAHVCARVHVPCDPGARWNFGVNCGTRRFKFEFDRFPALGMKLLNCGQAEQANFIR